MNSVDFTSSFRLIFIDVRLFHRSIVKRVFRRHPGIREVHSVPCVDSALKLVFTDRSPTAVPGKNLFLFGVDSYMKVESGIKRVVSCCPASKRILLDEKPKSGCAILVERFPIHGWLTSYDSPKTFNRCTDRVLRDKAFVSDKVADWLRVDNERHYLKIQDELKKRAPYTFSRNEWLCFKYLIENKDLSVLAGRLQLTRRTVRNIQYRVMEKSGVRKLTDLIRLAHQWGFLD